MVLPVHISFRGMPRYERIEQKIRHKLNRLSKAFPFLVRGTAVIEPTQHNQHSGNLYQVTLDVKLSRGEAIVSHHPGHHVPGGENVFKAVASALDALQNQLLKQKNHFLARKRNGA